MSLILIIISDDRPKECFLEVDFLEVDFKLADGYDILIGSVNVLPFQLRRNMPM